jgi:hypothetical protein
MRRFLSWLLVLVLLGALGAAAGYALWARAEAGKGLPAFSVYSEEADGLAEAARFLRRAGWDAVALTRPVQHPRQQGLLILAEPEGRVLVPGEEPDLSEGDVVALLRWVEQGNTLLLCGRHMTGLHRKLKASVTGDEEADAAHVVTAEPGDAGRYGKGVERLVVEGRSTVAADAGLPLWWVGPEPGAVLVRHGKGRVLVVADPSLLTSRGLRREDNPVFLYNVAAVHARGGKVYFDEYHHGLQSSGGFWGYLRHHGQQWAILPVLLVVALAVWRVAVRLGPAVPTPRETRGDAVDYASAVAQIYQRAGARRLMARVAARDFLDALTRHLRLRRGALPAEVLAEWQARHPKESAQRLQGLLRGLAELRKERLTDRQLLAWTRAFDEFQHDLAKG